VEAVFCNVVSGKFCEFQKKSKKRSEATLQKLFRSAQILSFFALEASLFESPPGTEKTFF